MRSQYDIEEKGRLYCHGEVTENPPFFAERKKEAREGEMRTGNGQNK